MIVQQCDRASAQFRSRYEEAAVWGLTEQLLARVVEALEKLWWAKTTAAKYGRNRPEPIWRPGVEKPEEEQAIGGVETALAIDELDAWLGWSPRVPSRTPERN